MAARPALDPSRLAPFFLLAALLHAAAIITRVDEVARQLPPIVASCVLLGSVAMLFIEGYFEGRLDYGPTLMELPLWMRIKSGPVKAAFTFAFTDLGRHLHDRPGELRRGDLQRRVFQLPYPRSVARPGGPHAAW
jgi:hypothetical protein